MGSLMKHKLVWHPGAWDYYLYWSETDKKLLKKINELIKAVDRDPFQGIGKPEPLLHELKDYLNRRIAREHRMVYSVNQKILTIV